MSILTKDYQAPEPYFTLRDGREIKMTFGLLNRLARISGNVETLGLIMVDSDLQQALLSQVFSTYDEKGRQIEVADIDSIEAPMDEILHILAWVLENLTYFFLRNLQNSAKIAQQYKAEEGEELSSKLSKAGSKV